MPAANQYAHHQRLEQEVERPRETFYMGPLYEIE